MMGYAVKKKKKTVMEWCGTARCYSNLFANDLEFIYE